MRRLAILPVLLLLLPMEARAARPADPATAAPAAGRAAPGTEDAAADAAAGQPQVVLDPWSDRRRIPPAAPSLDALELEHSRYAREWQATESLLGSSRQRRVRAVRDRARLLSGFFLTEPAELEREEVRDFVRDAYVKLYRETLGARFPFEERLEEYLEQRFSVGAGGEERGAGGASWSPRLSPRVAVGSGGYAGLKVSLPRAPNPVMSSMSLQLRESFDGDEGSWLGLKYDDGRRLIALEHTEDERHGRRFGLTMRFLF
ncbi:MAG TPA: hypothetical protein VMT16_00670 [Thermoanaerobaculia bacterium]|nr:hypothetical protein [Thermoanaerobaculia bacterium]